jgi:probable H4MPT-linked C1 transfer pathway protein
MPPELTTGWDIGGAHLKVAQVDRAGCVRTAMQLPCALWRGMEHLDLALTEARARLLPARRHGLTMTGELTDLFADRVEGVSTIAQAMSAAFARDEMLIYSGASGFVPTVEARRRTREIASANWHASTRFVASRVTAGLFVDIGSTTTDLVPFTDGEVRAGATSDDERLTTAELRYTGVTRTPVMALAQAVPFAGQMHPLMAELFATSADVHRLTGALPADADQHATADGRGYGLPESAARLARMLGRDGASAELDTWRGVALHLSEQQLRFIHEGAARVLSRVPLERDAPVVGAGVGRFLAVALAQRLQRPYIDFATLIDGSAETREWGARCAPAVAVAVLLAA